MKFKFLIAIAGSLLLSGCANMLDSAYGLGTDKPENAAPGYNSYREGMRLERENDLNGARVAFCNAAELGNTQAKPFCEKYSLIYAGVYLFNQKNSRMAEVVICNAKAYGPTANGLCAIALNSGDITPGLRAYLLNLPEFALQKNNGQTYTPTYNRYQQNTAPINATDSFPQRTAPSSQAPAVQAPAAAVPKSKDLVNDDEL